MIVGADRVAGNGDVANKIGTYGLAVLSQRHAVPFYVACPISTIDLTITRGADIPIEERELRGRGRTTCYFGAGDQTAVPSFHGLRVTFRCALPSRFIT